MPLKRVEDIRDIHLGDSQRGGKRMKLVAKCCLLCRVHYQWINHFTFHIVFADISIFFCSNTKWTSFVQFPRHPHRCSESLPKRVTTSVKIISIYSKWTLFSNGCSTRWTVLARVTKKSNIKSWGKDKVGENIIIGSQHQLQWQLLV